MTIKRSSGVDQLMRFFLITLLFFTIVLEANRALTTTTFSRSSFPEDFIFGTASSAYQYEGAVDNGGRGQSIWDSFTRTYPERTNMSNGDIAIDFYHRYKEDIKLMKRINMDAFRFSISWPRILPRGRQSGGVNKEGIQFYRDLIDELIENGLEPFVTIFHWDLPQVLEDEYGGFLSPRIVDDFRDFATLCFKEFGDKVKYWTTFNEPWVYSIAGYDYGKKAPGRCSSWVNKACQEGDSSIEPYIVSHHILLAHAAAVQEFRKYDQSQKTRKIGIVLSPPWFEPHTNSLADKEAVKRALDFVLGWHLNPVIFGEYPKRMKAFVGERLPSFSEEQSKMLKNSFDFIGINYYGALYASNIDHNFNFENPRYMTDQHVQWKKDRDGIAIGLQAASDMILVYPEGIRNLLNYIKDNYNNPTIYITENGYDNYNDETLTMDDALQDFVRIEYHEKHLESLSKAMSEDEVDVKGYFAWSLIDNFEWNLGYTVRFGLYYVDFKNGSLTRYPKESAKWFRRFLEKNKTKLIRSRYSNIGRKLVLSSSFRR